MQSVGYFCTVKLAWLGHNELNKNCCPEQ